MMMDTAGKDEALDALRQCLPYKAQDYEKHFTTLKALEVLRTFCKEHPDVEAVYGIGSIAHGLLVEGSDIDHPCIKVRRPLSYEEKVQLVDEIDPLIKAVGVSKLCCIRKHDYARVFYDWEELKSTPKADIRLFELYPGLDVLTLDTLEPALWMKTVLQTASGLPVGGPRPNWIQKTGDRIAALFHTEFTYFPNAKRESQFVFSPRTANVTSGYDAAKEYINITDYSPFCHINEVSEPYRSKPFMLPFYAFTSGDVRPVHPDTFTDLELNPEQIDHYRQVHPTASFRTVYEPRKNVCYKLPLMRTITRGLRDLPDVALQRSEYAAKKLAQFPFEGFSFLPEEAHYAADARHNYITRPMPGQGIAPWFYEIASQASGTKFQMKCMSNIIQTWMFYASKGVFLEYHTQNILVDREANIYFRDLSDVMIHDGGVSDRDWCKSTTEALAISFDRSVCAQNLDHAFRYNKLLGDHERRALKGLIRSEIRKYGLRFPTDHSLSFPLDQPIRTPVETPLISWRSTETARP